MGFVRETSLRGVIAPEAYHRIVAVSGNKDAGVIVVHVAAYPSYAQRDDPTVLPVPYPVELPFVDPPAGITLWQWAYQQVLALPENVGSASI